MADQHDHAQGGAQATVGAHRLERLPEGAARGSAVRSGVVGFPPLGWEVRVSGPLLGASPERGAEAGRQGREVCPGAAGPLAQQDAAAKGHASEYQYCLRGAPT